MEKKRRLFICVLVLLCGVMPVRAQDAVVKFGVPFDFPLYLSGNFGELRSNHFHGGLDFKTQSVVGKPILAIANGYISKVTVTPGGYGNALYITHDNGYTSVHGHLDRFLPVMAKLVHEKQHREQSFIVTLEFGSEDFPVRQGDIVAYAGNSGYSFGPHLHMEIRKTETNEPVDPLLFYKDKIADTAPPRATHIMLYGATRAGKVVLRKAAKSAVELDGRIIFNPQSSSFNSITAWGRISAAISANDYMDGTSNVYGVRYVRLYVDNHLVSCSDVNRFSFEENRLINSWIDYAEYRRTGRWYMRSSIAENNELRMLHADGNGGWVIIDEERDYDFRYELEDLYGNTTVYRFVVHGERMPVVSRLCDYRCYMDASRDVRFCANGFELWVPKGALFDDVELDNEVYFSDTDCADIYQLTAHPVPLRKSVELTLPIHQDCGIDHRKLYVARVDGCRRIYSGGTYKYGHIAADITELGTYTVCADTVTPKIIPIGETAWKKRGVVVFRISDAETGIRDYYGKIDGRWVLFKYSSKDARLSCDLHAEDINSGSHEVEVGVTDMRGNVKIVKVAI